MANNKIGQLIDDSITLSKASGLPILLMGNPGAGKTTHVRNWAKANGYEIEVLIGSRNTPEEIMGYQVNNGGAALQHLNPGWWDRVQANAKENKPTLVFVDELSVCPEVVQGSLLSLIADRENSEGERLPDDCLIVSAANYAGNLPSMMNILTPTLNRFIIINVLENMNNLEILEEFLTEQKPVKHHKYSPLDEKVAGKIDSDVFDFFKNLLATYSDKDSARGWLDFANTDLGNVYQDSVGNVYNIMTPRSCFYLQQAVKATIACGISAKEEIAAWANGLVGHGTNNFTDNKQGEKFRKTIATSINSICSKYVKQLAGQDVEKKVSNASSLSDKIHEFMMNKEGAEDLTDAGAGGLIDVYQDAVSKYGDVIEVAKKMENGVQQLDAAAYCSDIEALQELIMFFNETETQSNEVENLVKIHQDNYYMYCTLTGVHCDLRAMNDVYGVYTPKLINKVVVLKLKDGPRTKKGYQKAGIRVSGNNWMPFGMEKNESALKVSLAKSIYKDDIVETISPTIKD